LITTAHSVLPQPDKLFKASYPFLVYNENFQYGITSLNQWPFDYSVSATIIDSLGNKSRKFIEVGLFGLDWDSDLAVFSLASDITVDNVKCLELSDSLPHYFCR